LALNRKWETVLLIVLPILIVGLIIYNAGAMNRIYMTENGLNQESKIYKARIMPDQYDITAAAGDKISLNIELLNQSSFIWSPGGSHPVHLSYHVLDGSKKMLQYDNERFNLPHDMRPDDDVKFNVEMNPKLQLGDYSLELDMVEEGVAWFGEKGSPTTVVKLHVK
jgi:hypothetical protein